MPVAPAVVVIGRVVPLWILLCALLPVFAGLGLAALAIGIWPELEWVPVLMLGAAAGLCGGAFEARRAWCQSHWRLEGSAAGWLLDGEPVGLRSALALPGLWLLAAHGRDARGWWASRWLALGTAVGAEAAHQRAGLRVALEHPRPQGTVPTR